MVIQGSCVSAIVAAAAAAAAAAELLHSEGLCVYLCMLDRMISNLCW